MIRLIPVLIGLLLLIAAFKWLTARAGAVADRFTPQPRDEGGRPGRYEFDKRREQVYRDIRKVPRAPERRDELVSWLDAHSGVEAYVEPKTVMSPKSVVLVDAEGEWRRFELGEDRFLRELARERSLPIFDAARTGYPPRMRRRRDRP